jgi:hypothetical protein
LKCIRRFDQVPLFPLLKSHHPMRNSRLLFLVRLSFTPSRRCGPVPMVPARPSRPRRVRVSRGGADPTEKTGSHQSSYPSQLTFVKLIKLGN